MSKKAKLKHLVYALIATPILIGALAFIASKSTNTSQPEDKSLNNIIKSVINDTQASAKTALSAAMAPITNSATLTAQTTAQRKESVSPTPLNSAFAANKTPLPTNSSPLPKSTPQVGVSPSNKLAVATSISSVVSSSSPVALTSATHSGNLDSLSKEISSLTKNSSTTYSIAFEKLGTSGVQLIQNSQKMQSASIIKVFIMLEAYNQIKNNSLDKNKSIVLKDNMKVGGAGSLSGQKEGYKVSVTELINMMITQSDNTATNILIDTLGFDSINKTIRNLGFSDTLLQRKMMDAKAISQGKDNYTSVTDLLSFFRKLYLNDCLSLTYDKEMIEILKNQRINFKIPLFLPGGTVIAHKTGELAGVENDGGIVFSGKGDYILCIMTSKVTSVESARNTIGNISKVLWSFNTTH